MGVENTYRETHACVLALAGPEESQVRPASSYKQQAANVRQKTRASERAGWERGRGRETELASCLASERTGER